MAPGVCCFLVVHQNDLHTSPYYSGNVEISQKRGKRVLSVDLHIIHVIWRSFWYDTKWPMTPGVIVFLVFPSVFNTFCDNSKTEFSCFPFYLRDKPLFLNFFSDKSFWKAGEKVTSLSCLKFILKSIPTLKLKWIWKAADFSPEVFTLLIMSEPFLRKETNLETLLFFKNNTLKPAFL